MAMINRYLQPENSTVRTALGSALLLAAILLTVASCHKAPVANASQEPASSTNAQGEASVELSASNLTSIKIEPVGTYLFPVEKEAVGTIAFVDDLSVQVFPPYQGKILKAFVELGDEVQKGQPLYTIDSPDLIQAESTLNSAAATFELSSKELARAKELYATNVGVSQRELEQATSDAQTAEGALKAARDAMRLFGKSDDEVDQIIATHKIDSTLIVRSPMAGEVTAYNAPPGLLVQPGTAPAPVAVADVSIKWMLANVIETDSPLFQAGQPVAAKVAAFPGRVFDGKISKIYASVDPNTHRVTIRSDIADPHHELRPGMLATFVIQVQAPAEATAIPVNGVVREGNGAMTAWVTADRKRFLQRTVKLGLQNGGMYQVLGGLTRGELAVTDGAIFLDNMLQAPPTD
jgi:cobalt-zinc-cadmium efflux system membrane fusion protein